MIFGIEPVFEGDGGGGAGDGEGQEMGKEPNHTTASKPGPL
jgi:hypothetical protein